MEPQSESAGGWEARFSTQHTERAFAPGKSIGSGIIFNLVWSNAKPILSSTDVRSQNNSMGWYVFSARSMPPRRMRLVYGTCSAFATEKQMQFVVLYGKPHAKPDC